MQLLVPKKLMVRAYIDTKGLLDKLRKGRQAVKPRRERRGGGYDPKSFLGWYDEELKQLYVDESKKFVRSVGEIVEGVVNDYVKWVVGNQYLPGLYLLSTYLFPVNNVVPFLAVPPHITHPETYPLAQHVKTYFDMFVPHGRSRNMIAKYFFSEFYAVLQMQMPRLAERVPELGKLFNAKLGQYLERGDPKKVARSKAYKDVVRVYIGNAWLVWIYYAYQTGLVKHVILPYHLAKEPELHAYMVDPWKLVIYGKHISPEDVKHITWRWLIETAQEQYRGLKQ